ncbi:MAG: hypothetical protein JWL61_4993 [Gemmatimonadetes bacterium]|nr:hypothetical protein [Gemmatimonadota bacterium]
MIVLDSTKKLRIVLAAAKTTLDASVTVHWEDVPAGGNSVGAPVSVWGSLSTVTNGTTVVDICASPSTGYTRKITSIHLYNVDTGTITPTISTYDGTTTSPLIKGTRATLETLSYEDRGGWQGYSVAMARQ